MWWAMEQRPYSCVVKDKFLAFPQFLQVLAKGYSSIVRVRVCVIAEPVAFIQDAAQHLRGPLDAVTYYKKNRFNSKLLKSIQNSKGYLWMRTVVKRKKQSPSSIWT